MTMRIGLLLFPQLTVLDLIGPYEVWSRLPDVRLELIWHESSPVRTEHGLMLTPSMRCDDVDKLDVLCVPGGFGVTPLLNHAPTIDFIRRVGGQAHHLTSVCSGALLLGAAGLLKGRRATTHWGSMDMLAAFGAVPVEGQRIVQDGPVITGGGVTAGIDFALYLVEQWQGREAAQSIQLAIEYNPAPPQDAGHPSKAPAACVAEAKARGAQARAERWEAIRQATCRMERMEQTFESPQR